MELEPAYNLFILRTYSLLAPFSFLRNKKEKKQADESIYSQLNILKIRYYPVSKPVRVVVPPVGLGLEEVVYIDYVFYRSGLLLF